MMYFSRHNTDKGRHHEHDLCFFRQQTPRSKWRQQQLAPLGAGLKAPAVESKALGEAY